MTPDHRPTDLGEELRRSVGRFVRATRATADTLPSSRAEVLGELARGGPRSMPELARARRVTHQSVSRTMGDLERLGLVARTPHPSDARGFLFALTRQGRAALEADRGARRDTIATALDVLTAEERRLLARVPGILDRLTDAIDRPAPG